jgi:hypothetical protein
MDTFPRAVAAYLATAIFGVLAWFHLALPASLTQPKLVAAIVLVAAAVSTVVRVKRGGPPEADAKAWWQSKTIWSAVVAAGVAVLALFDAAPSVDANSIVAIVLTVFGLLNAYLYPTVAQPIASVSVGGSPPPALLAIGLVAGALFLSLPGCASTSAVRLDVDRAFVVAELGFQSAQETALAGVQSGAVTGDARARTIDLIEQGQRYEDDAVAARHLANYAGEAAALTKLASIVAAIHPLPQKAN